MSKSNLKYDYQFMSASKVGGFGFKKIELKKLQKNLVKSNQKLKNDQVNPDYSFTQLPYEMKMAQDIKNIGQKLIKNFANLVIVGIGGSDLGARAIYSALPKKKQALNIYFLGDTPDPLPIQDLLAKIDLKKTVFHVVSKSGGTIEPLANLLYLRQAVIKKVGYQRHKDHFIITTNPEKGSLLEIAQKEKYNILYHYPVGGRFSVLSVNGLLPLVCAGYDPLKMLLGARQIDKLAKSNNVEKNSPFLFAALHYLGYKKRRQNINVLMPYTYALKDFALWFCQLWAESLGNKKDLAGKVINAGITPVASLGPTDQHSQIQLYVDGPYDKIIDFIFVAENKNNLQVPKYNNFDGAFLGGHKFTDILKIEHLATSVSLMKNKRPNATIIIPELDEFYLGQLFYFFQMSTFYLGELLNVNSFDQPGVEQSKNYMYGLLGKKGFEKYKKEL